MGYALKIGKKDVPFDDLTPAAWQRIDDAGPLSWADAYLAPLRSMESAMAIVVECVRVAEPEADATARSLELAPSIRALSDMVIEVEDDMPTTFRDGVPTVGDAETSTPT